MLVEDGKNLHISEKIGWVVVERGRNLHILEEIGWVFVGAGKNLHILEENGWVGVFIAKTDFFIICSAIFFLTPPPVYTIQN